MIDRKFFGGFAFNRKHFHTNIDACIMVAWWGFEKCDNEKIVINGYDIQNNILTEVKQLEIKKIHSLFSEKYYEKKKMEGASYDGILVGLNGLEVGTEQKIRIKPLFSDNMIGYLVADSVGFDNPDAKSSLLIAGWYNGNGFYLHKDNYLEKLPMFAASRYIAYNRCWTERARIMKSADGADRFFLDIKNGKLRPFLLKCLLFTVLEPQNHMRSFTGSDGRKYVNNLCLDNSNEETIASCDLKKMTMNRREKTLVEQWEKILSEAKLTAKYDSSRAYGLYQVKTELNTTHKDEETNATVYDYPGLNGNIKALAELVRKYYKIEIVPVLFEYEFLK